MPFDPDKYLAKNVAALKAFDPDVYLAKSQPQEQPAWEGYARGTLKALPLAGGAAGAFLGNVPGAMLGAAGGAAVEQAGEALLNKYLGKSNAPNKGILGPFQHPVEEAASVGIGEGLFRGLGKAGELAAETSAGKAIIGSAKKGALKVSEALTGVPEKIVETYAKSSGKVKDLLKQSGGDIGIAADEIRDKTYQGILSEKAKLSKQIADTLAQSDKMAHVPVTGILKKLQSYRDKLDPDFQAKAIQDIDEIAGVIAKAAPNGVVNLQKLNSLKNYLQEEGQSAYFQGGQVFVNPRTSDGAIAAKGAAAEARTILNDLAPNIKAANSKLSEIHDVMDELNKSLITSGKAEGSLLAIGSGATNRNSAALERLGELTGQSPIKDAELLATAKLMKNPPLLPMYSTGKSVLATGLGSGGGAGLAHELGFDEKKGALVGGALTSPLMLRTLIDSGLMGQGLLKSPLLQAPLKQEAGRGLLRR